VFLRRWQKKKAFYIILISQIVKNPARVLIFRKNGLYWFIARFEKDLDQTDHFQETSVPNANLILAVVLTFPSVPFHLPDIFKTFGSKIIFHVCI